MSTQGGIPGSTTRTDTDPRPVPGDLGSAEAKLVYHSLDAAGPGDVDELAGRLGLKKMSLFSVLDSLERQEYVESDGRRYYPA